MQEGAGTLHGDPDPMVVVLFRAKLRDRIWRTTEDRRS
jgi:hypothetical protein